MRLGQIQGVDCAWILSPRMGRGGVCWMVVPFASWRVRECVCVGLVLCVCRRCLAACSKIGHTFTSNFQLITRVTNLEIRKIVTNLITKDKNTLNSRMPLAVRRISSTMRIEPRVPWLAAGLNYRTPSFRSLASM